MLEFEGRLKARIHENTQGGMISMDGARADLCHYCNNKSGLSLYNVTRAAPVATTNPSDVTGDPVAGPDPTDHQAGHAQIKQIKYSVTWLRLNMLQV